MHNNILSIRELPYLNIRSWIIGIVACLSFSFTQTLGDLNQDGFININDILREVNIVLELSPPPTEYEIISGDLNVDEVIDITDILITVDIILNNLESYCTNDQWDIPCENNYSECCYPITSHEFEWEVDTFGVDAYAFSELRDAYIINKNNIWVVGIIHSSDSTFLPFYNAIHWDGLEWQETQILNQEGNYSSGHSFFALNQLDLWFGTARPYHYYGEYWWRYGNDYGHPTELGVIDKTWGTDFNNMFFFNSTADVVHWDGTEFTIMETSTGSGDGWVVNPNFIDVVGLDENHIYALTRKQIYDPIWDYPQTIQVYNGSEWNDLYYFDHWDLPCTQGLMDLKANLHNIWAFEDTLYVNATCGLWKESILTREGYYSTPDNTFVNFKGAGLKGNHPNDIITLNWQGQYAHFNGESWQHNTELAEYFGLGNIYCDGMVFKDNTIILFGNIFEGLDWPVFIARGTRSE